MSEYTITWTIQVEAPYHRAAAAEALRIMRDPESTATVFEVSGPNGEDTERTMTVDLDTYTVR